MAIAAFAAAWACGNDKPSVPSTSPRAAEVAGASLPAARFPAAAMDAHLASHGRHHGEGFTFSGYVVVEHMGKVIYERGLGITDEASRAVPDRDTNMALASLSKQFAATAILLLEQDGRLAVTDVLGKHLPQYPKVGRGLTIAQLLTHSSGLINHAALPQIFDHRGEAIEVDALLATFDHKPLEFAPGTKEAYSNAGYAVLAAIVAAASQQPYAEFLAQRLFAPAGLARTRVGEASDLANRADGFTVGPAGERVAAPRPHYSVLFGAADVRSTARDMLTWYRHLSGGKLLSRDAWLRMITTASQTHQFAYGWRVTRHEGRPLISHGGILDGVALAFWAMPDAQLVIFVWSNNDAIDAETIAEAAYAGFRGQAIALARETVPVAVPPAQLAAYHGTYELDIAARRRAIAAGTSSAFLDSIATLEVGPAGKLLRVHRKYHGVYFVAPTSETVFVSPPRQGLTLTFAPGRLTAWGYPYARH
ncbi:MAG: beta-lactamase family protein [Myxococcales bacterium]|nr:beta-lactamase family protein [Myxococcales bacterium]